MEYKSDQGATNFETAWIHFIKDVFASILVVVAFKLSLCVTEVKNEDNQDNVNIIRFIPFRKSIVF